MKLLSLACALLLIADHSPAQQRTAAKQTARKTGSPQAVGGVMRGREIAIEMKGGRRHVYTLEEAQIVAGRLQFVGSSTTLPRFLATLVGTTARSENPIPRATDASAPRREGPRSSPRPAAELNEQTQSLYAASEAGTGCELIYLRIETSPPTQLGVVLAHRDNPFGLELNQAICRIRRAIDAGAETSAPLAALNQLLKENK